MKSMEPWFYEIHDRLTHDDRIMISLAREWIAEGWGLEDDPTMEQVLAALLMEAGTQDECVKEGVSSPEYPKKLRALALRLFSFSIGA